MKLLDPYAGLWAKVGGSGGVGGAPQWTFTLHFTVVSLRKKKVPRFISFYVHSPLRITLSRLRANYSYTSPSVSLCMS